MGFSGMGVETGVSVAAFVGVSVGGRGVAVVSERSNVGLAVSVLDAAPQTLTPEMDVSVANALPVLSVCGNAGSLLAQPAMNKTSKNEYKVI